jgi:hypothetical protein
MPDYNTGIIEEAYFTRYEEVECFLTMIYLSLEPLKSRNLPQDKKDYEDTIGILRGLAEVYNIQSPEEAIRTPRIEAKPRPFRNVSSMWELIDSSRIFLRIERSPNKSTPKLWNDLRLRIKEILIRHNAVREDVTFTDKGKMNLEEILGRELATNF